MNEGRLIRKIIDIGVMLECGNLDYEGAENDAKAVIEEIRHQCNITNVVATEGECCGCEESTGETKLWCCNHCGKRVERFY